MALIIREGTIYQCDHTDGLFEVVHVPETRPPDDNQTIGLTCLADGQRYGVYRDNFRKGYTKVADSTADLSEGDR